MGNFKIGLVLLISLFFIKVYAATFVVTTADDNGNNLNPTPGSLRAAIISANQIAQNHDIVFCIPGFGVKVIQPPAPLPAIEQTVKIDGYTQPGAQAATNICKAFLKIVIDGTNAGVSNGLNINSSGSIIKGLVINNFTLNGIKVLADRVIIAGNYIGTNSDGSMIMANGLNGIKIKNGQNTIIGGMTQAARNIISGNNKNGIKLDNALNSIISGNDIGTNVDGTEPLGNIQNGIKILNGGKNFIGGLIVQERNLISGNGKNGIEINQSNFNFIKANHIGTNFVGADAIANAENGIFLNLGSDNTIIGGFEEVVPNVISGNSLNGVKILSNQNQIIRNFIGTDTTATLDISNSNNGILINGSNNKINCNIITKNKAVGVLVDGPMALFNAILANSIFSNVDTGIDLINHANNDQPAPILDFATASGCTIGVGGRLLNSVPNSRYRIEFFINDLNNNEAGITEGKTFVGRIFIETDQLGFAQFDQPTVPAEALAKVGIRLDSNANICQFVSATATLIENGKPTNSSEYSQNVQLTQGPDESIISARIFRKYCNNDDKPCG